MKTVADDKTIIDESEALITHLRYWSRFLLQKPPTLSEI